MQWNRKQKFLSAYNDDYYCRSATLYYIHKDYNINPDYLGNLCASVSHLLTFSEIFEEAHVFRQSGARCIILGLWICILVTLLSIPWRFNQISKNIKMRIKAWKRTQLSIKEYQC